MPHYHSLGSGIYAYAPAGPKGLAPPGQSWENLMDLALAEAARAAATGDCPVGAVIVDGRGELVARACNRVEAWHNPCAHAEILAIMGAAQKRGSQRLTNCTLVVTLEPCLMCAGAIAHSRLPGVVFGAADARAGALVSAADAASLPFGGRTFWHLGGVRSAEAGALLEDFFAKRRSLS